MLLLFVILFLNAIQIIALKLVPGWDVSKDRGPKHGGVYFLKPGLVGKDVVQGERIPCIVLYELEEDGWNSAFFKRNDARTGSNLYRVAVMMRATDNQATDRRYPLPAASFFPDGAQLQTSGSRKVLFFNYRIYPHDTHLIAGDPDIMNLFEGLDLSIMPEEDLGRLVVASGLVDGWHPSQHGPQLRGVYWIRSHILGIEGEPGLSIPCVVLRRLLNEHQGFVNKYRVVMMSRAKDPNGQPAMNFFQAKTKLGLPITKLDDITNYFIHPGQNYEVKGRPYIMQKWGQHVLVMSRLGADKLEAAVHEIMQHHHHHQRRSKIFQDYGHGFELIPARVR